jgi:HPt (histidine-containing phosphotransfer) domain-containing protein
MSDNVEDSRIFDREGFLHRMMDDIDLAVEIMKEFLVDMDDQIQRLTADTDKADLPALVRLAHTIKGASANVGAKELQRTAFLAEQAAARCDRDGYIRMIPDIKEQLELLKSLLDRIGYFKNS